MALLRPDMRGREALTYTFSRAPIRVPRHAQGADGTGDHG
jgi:hypothetical protein